MELKDIQQLIEFVANSEVREVALEKDDFKITIRTRYDEPAPREVTGAPMMPSYYMHPAMTGGMAPPSPSGTAPPPASAPAQAPSSADHQPEDNLLTIRSPMIGTFYRRPSPDQEVLVKVGTPVKKGDVVCVIEAMKLFNEIESEVEGQIARVLVEDAQPVEYDQPLFLVEPS